MAETEKTWKSQNPKKTLNPSTTFSIPQKHVTKKHWRERHAEGHDGGKVPETPEDNVLTQLTPEQKESAAKMKSNEEKKSLFVHPSKRKQIFSKAIDEDQKAAIVSAQSNPHTEANMGGTDFGLKFDENKISKPEETPAPAEKKKSWFKKIFSSKD